MSQIVVCRDPFRVSMSETCIMAFSGKRWILGANTAACRDSALQSLLAILGLQKIRYQPILVACRTNALRRSLDDLRAYFRGDSSSFIVLGASRLAWWVPNKRSRPAGPAAVRYSSYFGLRISAMMTAFRKSKFSVVSCSAAAPSVLFVVFWMRFRCITAG